MTRSEQKIALVIAVAALPVIGYGLMHGATYAMPGLRDSVLAQILFTLFIIAAGLAVPYWVLKLGMHKMHLDNPAEKEVQLKDIPKDKDDLNRAA